MGRDTVILAHGRLGWISYWKATVAYSLVIIKDILRYMDQGWRACLARQHHLFWQPGTATRQSVMGPDMVILAQGRPAFLLMINYGIVDCMHYLMGSFGRLYQQTRHQLAGLVWRLGCLVQLAVQPRAEALHRRRAVCMAGTLASAAARVYCTAEGGTGRGAIFAIWQTLTHRHGTSRKRAHRLVLG